MLSEEAAAHYLAAMIDGEGTVTLPDRTKCRAVRITNTDWGLIQACAECCEALGIAYRIQVRGGDRPAHWKQGWDLVIGRRSALERLRDKIFLRSAKKRERLNALVTSYRVSRCPPHETLKVLYIDQQRSLAGIMHATGAKSIATVRYWLRRAGIPIRSLSDAAKIDWAHRRLRAIP